MSNPEDLICRHVRAMHGYVPGEQPKIPGLIKLNTNENPYPPSPRVADAIQRTLIDSLRLYPDPLCTALRGKIATLHDVEVEQVFVGNGSDEVLALCTRAFVEDDGAIGCFDPSYSLYPVLADIRSVKLKPVELAPDFTWRMSEGYHASLFYLTNPNAPTSMAFPKTTIRTFCESFSGVVLIDEAYADFAPDNCMDLAKRMSNVLVSRTFSKSYSLAGIRAGYVVGHAKLISAMYTIKDSYNVNALTQKLALAAINDQLHMRENVDRIIATRERVAKELAKRGYTVYPSAANFLWVTPIGISAADLFKHLREQKILTRYFPGEKTGHCLRITIGTDEQMDALLSSLPQ